MRINMYVTFIIEFVNYTKDSPEQNTQSELGSPAIEEQLKSVDISGVDFDELMSRIRHVVLTNRRRVDMLCNIVVENN